MNEFVTISPPRAVSSLSSVALASVLDQSVDCVKLVGLEGDVQYMNINGLCAMEIDDFHLIAGKPWADLWPEEARALILASYPRASGGETVRFRAFCPTAKGSPRWWDVTVSAVTNDDGEHAGYLSVSRDATESEEGRQASAIATAELRHRLKNTYTMIGSLLSGFARGNAQHEQFASEMTDRLVALSRAQALFANTDAPCRIDQLVAALVEPFDSEQCPVSFDGLLPIEVDQGRADAIALVIGELAVNSAKHGAFHHGGAVRVSAVGDDRSVSIVWDERCDCTIESHGREGGQGLRLIERIMRARRGTIATAWRDDGLVVTLTFLLS
ncbi:PAS domain-containing protein [Sphingomonas immobilis]|uniref:histidine kinase n=1 Tax=Sphingomonas immobilis TaxID=3063997 RepID=A0ABT9A324_9SPHN|nr:PAS domain-containing protein [Sphingomonas sp. CA1-15]MDO7843948.1 PAS domain-containing protein [Sphingomonas sp. CA1-15]